MVDASRNTWRAKIKRNLAAIVFPVAYNRKGKCHDCGECCKLPVECSFLDYDNGKSYCTIYPLRSPSCRKYPRTESEQITKDTCGYWFE